MTIDSLPNSMICFVIEDDPLLASILAGHLEERHGVTCTVFETADDALFQIMDGTTLPALVVTDHLVPGSIRGAELASMIHSKWPGISVIVTSGYAYDLGDTLPPNTVFLSKPWSIEQLDQAVSRLKIGSDVLTQKG